MKREEPILPETAREAAEERITDTDFGEAIRQVPPGVETEGVEESEVDATASQWQLIWRKFRKHGLAMWSLRMLVVLYLVSAFCEFLAPMTPDSRNLDYAYAPPQMVRFISPEGLGLYVHPLETWRDPITMEREFREDRETREPIRFLIRGEPYKLWGLFPGNLHLFGVENGTLFLLGADSMGRDLLSRILYGTRISLSIGLIGVALSFLLGLFFGVLSGYYGGWIDNLIQRTIEIIQAFPNLPLWMALAAALPATWTSLQIYFGITVVLSLIGWTGLARQVRGKILSLREEDFATAAMLAGASQNRIMWRHLLPSFMSHIIVSLSLSVPGMILAETGLSFLGLGLRPPTTSWGVLLQEAQNIQVVGYHPWLLLPVFCVVLAVLAFNFVGDGLRDASDPYK